MAINTSVQREAKRKRDREYQAKRRAALKAGKPLTKTVVKIADAPQLTNHIAIVIDKSGSMASLSATVVDQLNKQIANIKAQAYATKQKTTVSVYTFSGRHQLNLLVDRAFPEAVNMFTFRDYYPGGQTALLDAIQEVSSFQRSMDDGAKTTSFLMVFLTDGQENDSCISRHTVQDIIRQLQGTDRWTFVMLMPPGGKSYALNLGIPEGNIKEWETTRWGLEQASYQTVSSTEGYYAARSLGATHTKSFFTDLSQIGTKDLKKLDDLQGQFKRWQVKKECDISQFVEDQGYRYEIGRAFYQLTKPEKIQAHKEFVIEDRNTKHLYGGDQARNLLGISGGPGVTVRVRPGNHANYNLFVQSTSMNRKLVRGTTVLYRA